ncbi:hypothetical protein HPP92_017103 [Vanilla planifolia]|uniref:Uncharacterized protein n=1 Tax=Vanilla planifolia TaxID=51239 RepID=A0A835QBR0_VANPL|nr:hypothetical protein HPP92_017103 [Vanilla planifolia]
MLGSLASESSRTDEEAEDMEEIPGFITAYREQEHTASTTYTPTFLGLKGTASKTLWFDSSMGAGQIIGVVDTGIDPYHASFNDAGMPPPPVKWSGKCFWTNTRTCNNKILGAVAFRHRTYANPEDNDGHGTHVASTAAGNFVSNANVLQQAAGTASGMAPLAHLAIYKVLFVGPDGRSVGTDADILAGIEQAIRDHVDILQMSLGSARRAMAQSAVAIGSFAAITKGIVPCAAFGNDGPTASVLANDAPWILTVGASTVDRKIVASVTLGSGTVLAGESAYQPASSPSKQLPLSFPYKFLKTFESKGCILTELQKLNLQGKIAMCYRSSIADYDRGRNVLNVGGSGMILLNPFWQGNTTNAYEHALPASHLNGTGSKLLIDYYMNSANPTASISFSGTQFGINPAPAVADFSSRGPSFTNGGIIKPDVIAPGVNILAAWPRPVGPIGGAHFNFLSGTSMATPHVSGIVALLRNKHPNWPPAVIKSALMTTAYTLDSVGNPITDDFLGVAASVFAMGSGHVDPEAANDPGMVYELYPYDYVHYLCGYYRDDAAVSSIVQGPVQCARVRAIAPEQLNYPSFGVTLGGTTVVTLTRRVTNVGEAGDAYNVYVDEPDGVRVDVIPSRLQFSQVGEVLSYDVKFSLKGTIPTPVVGEVKEGRLSWISGKHLVGSPIAVTIV